MADQDDFSHRPVGRRSAVDLSARVLGPQLSKILEVPVQVVNKPGGSGIAAPWKASRLPRRVHPLMDCNGNQFNPEAWGEKLPYKVEERTLQSRASLPPS